MSDKKQSLGTASKKEALKAAMAAIEKTHGKGSIMQLKAGENLSHGVEAISTGVLSLDLALGIKGLPKGRIVEIFGNESSGKTTIALQVLAQAQKNGGTVAFVDAEHALDVNYARKLGVNPEDMLISQPDNGEQALEITETLVRSGAIDVIVVDSVAALTPRAELEGNMGDSHMGLQARLMSQALRKLTAVTNQSNTLIIFINQIRMKIGVMFGNPETTTGGNALKFYSSVRLEVRRGAALKDGDEVIGSLTTVKVVKNKMAPPFTKAEFNIMFGEGAAPYADVFNLAVAEGLIEKTGAWFTINGERFQGEANAKLALKENPKLVAELREKVIASRTTNPNSEPIEGTSGDLPNKGALDQEKGEIVKKAKHK